MEFRRCLRRLSWLYHPVYPPPLAGEPDDPFSDQLFDLTGGGVQVNAADCLVVSAGKVEPVSPGKEQYTFRVRSQCLVSIAVELSQVFG